LQKPDRREWIEIVHDEFKPLPPVKLSRDELLMFLPTNPEHQLEWLRTRRVWPGVKRPCPTGVAWHPQMDQYLTMEADIKEWGLGPFEGAPWGWDWEILQTLRVIRGTRAMIQNKRLQPKKQERTVGQAGDSKA
jgi:hypothetical protein